MRVLDPAGRVIAETTGLPLARVSTAFPPPVRADQAPGLGVEIAAEEAGPFIVVSALAENRLTHQPSHVQVALGQNSTRKRC